MKKVQEYINGIYMVCLMFIGIHILERVQIIYIYQFTISFMISMYLENKLNSKLHYDN